MTTQDWKSQVKTMPAIYHVIKERGLTKNLEELDSYGLTVITPNRGQACDFGSLSLNFLFDLFDTILKIRRLSDFCLS